MERTTVLICTYFLQASMLACAETMETCVSPQYVIMGEIGTIQCNFSAGFFGIFWYNTTDYINEYSVLNLKESGISGPGYTSGEFDIHPNGSLVIKDVTLAHNGIFTVVKLDSAFQDVVPHFVTVVVQAFPTPPYPIIEGCEQQKSCAVKVAHRGNLSCSVLGIHPQVELAWEIPREETSLNFIRMSQHTKRRPEGTFDVHLKSEFFINDTSLYSQNVKCKVIWMKGAPTLDIESKVFLLFQEEKTPFVQPTDKIDVEGSGFHGLLVIVIVVIALVVAAVAAVVGIFVARRVIASKKYSSPKEKDVESQQKQPLLEMKKRPPELTKMIGSLKQKYEEIYHSTQPLATIRSKSKTKNVFFESDLQSLTFKEGTGKHGVWESVKSVEAVLKDQGLKSTKFIIEGDHGYIKSTLGIELAYDWCTEERSSFMKEFEVLLYLKLSQLNAKTLTFNSLDAIFLGNDKTERKYSIEKICAHTSNVAVLLDAFNYSPGDNDGSSHNLDKLISSPVFEKFTVILLSAPSLLESIYHLGDVKRIRVSGTNKQTRDNFVTQKTAMPVKLDNDTQSTLVQKNYDIAGSNFHPMEDTNSTEEGVTQAKDGENVKGGKSLVNEQQEESKTIEKNRSPIDDGDYMKITTMPKETSDSTKKSIVPEQQCPIPMDLLVNPYFFTILSTISEKVQRNVQYESITKFFEEILNYVEKETNQEKEIGPTPIQQILHRIAFESLTFIRGETKFWNIEQLNIKMGTNFYESCKSKGYFIEEGVQCSNSKNESTDSTNLEAQVRFSNTFFCEWFAAHYIIHMRETSSPKAGKKYCEDIITKLFSSGYWYCLRFLCGLNKDFGEKILKLTKDRYGFHFFCAIETYGGIAHTLDTVKKMLPKEISIKLKDSKLDVMALLQLLDTLATNKMKIPRLILENCFNGPSSSIDLVLKSGVELPVLNTLMDLEITEEGRTLTENEATAIFNYVLLCNNMKSVKLLKCLLPQHLGEMTFPGPLEEKNLEVKWKPLSKKQSFLFDMENHRWKNNKGVLLTNDEYVSVVKEFQNLV